MQRQECSVIDSSRAGNAPPHPPNTDDGNDGNGGLTEPWVAEDGDVPNGGGGDDANQSTNSDF